MFLERVCLLITPVSLFHRALDWFARESDKHLLFARKRLQAQELRWDVASLLQTAGW